MQKLIKKIEKILYARGFYNPVIRKSMLVLIIANALALVLALATVFFNSWLLVLCIGLALITYNFWTLCQFTFKYVSEAYSRGLLLRQQIQYLLKLLLSGVIIVAVVYFNAPILAFIVGFSLGLLIISVTALTQFKRQNI